MRRLRLARGEQARGFKIGFTNRTIWPVYQVYAPIWGTVWDRTLAFADGVAEVSLAGCCQPRIEPELVFGMAATPPRDPTLAQLVESIAWMAPGFEVVQCHLPDWRFQASDTVADSGLHAWLRVGRRLPLSAIAQDAAALDEALAQAGVTLLRNGTIVARGSGRLVLDSPLRALQHFLADLRACPGAPELQPGDVVTTGTWTDAWPLAAGDRYEARFTDPLPSLTLQATA